MNLQKTKIKTYKAPTVYVMASIAVLTLFLLHVNGEALAQETKEIPSSAGQNRPVDQKSDKIFYQGNLTKGGQPVNGSYCVQFAIYDELETGNQLWPTHPEKEVSINTETPREYHSVNVYNGQFQALLGSHRAIPSDLRLPAYVEIDVAQSEDCIGVDYVRLRPRQRLFDTVGSDHFSTQENIRFEFEESLSLFKESSIEIGGVISGEGAEAGLYFYNNNTVYQPADANQVEVLFFDEKANIVTGYIDEDNNELNLLGSIELGDRSPLIYVTQPSDNDVERVHEAIEQQFPGQQTSPVQRGAAYDNDSGKAYLSGVLSEVENNISYPVIYEFDTDTTSFSKPYHDYAKVYVIAPDNEARCEALHPPKIAVKDGIAVIQCQSDLALILELRKSIEPSVAEPNDSASGSIAVNPLAPYHLPPVITEISIDHQSIISNVAITEEDVLVLATGRDNQEEGEIYNAIYGIKNPTSPGADSTSPQIYAQGEGNGLLVDFSKVNSFLGSVDIEAEEIKVNYWQRSVISTQEFAESMTLQERLQLTDGLDFLQSGSVQGRIFLDDRDLVISKRSGKKDVVLSSEGNLGVGGHPADALFLSAYSPENYYKYIDYGRGAQGMYVSDQSPALVLLQIDDTVNSSYEIVNHLIGDNDGASLSVIECIETNTKDSNEETRRCSQSLPRYADGVDHGYGRHVPFSISRDGLYEESRVAINGNLEVTGEITSQAGSDLAERFPVSEETTLPLPGEVVVIDTEHPEHVTVSAIAYDRKVIGVVTTEPALLIGKPQAAEASVALVGRVPVKVTDENGPINPGDLLVTSSRPGYAMRGDDSANLTGRVIGKAMESLSNGEGTVVVFLTLR